LGGATSKKSPQATDPDDILDELDSAKAEAKAARRDMQAHRGATKDTGAQNSNVPEVGPPNIPAGLPALDRENTPGLERRAGRQADAKPPVVPLPNEKPPPLNAAKSKEPSELAIQFMRWLQSGLSEGWLKHNEGGAPVHFIDYGMALVSPSIFKQFAAAQADAGQLGGDVAQDEFAMDVQREVIRAQWHVPAPGGKNVWTLYVVRKPGSEPSKLAAVVLKDPHLWVVPVPPPNPYILSKKPVVDELDGE
jgi:hypothetical protein